MNEKSFALGVAVGAMAAMVVGGVPHLLPNVEDRVAEFDRAEAVMSYCAKYIMDKDQPPICKDEQERAGKVFNRVMGDDIETHTAILVRDQEKERAQAQAYQLAYHSEKANFALNAMRRRHGDLIFGIFFGWRHAAPSLGVRPIRPPPCQKPRFQAVCTWTSRQCKSQSPPEGSAG